MSTDPSRPSHPMEAEQLGPRKPLKFLFKYLMNPLMRWLLRSRFHTRVSGRLMLLSFTGRTSGRRYTTPIGYRREGDRLVAHTHSPFWWNLKDGAPVRVVLEGREYAGWAEATRDHDQVWPPIEEFAGKHGAREALMMIGSFPRGKGNVSMAELRGATRGLARITITLEQPAR